MQKPLFIMFVGTPGSGKTTFARLLAKELGAVTLNSDAVRISMWGDLERVKAAHVDPNDRVQGNKLTFGALDYAAGQILAAGYSVVYDANANKVAERRTMAAIAVQNNGLAVVVRIKTPPALAVQRIIERPQSHDQRQHDAAKAHEIVESFSKAIEEPDATEHTVEISGEQAFEEQYAVFWTAVSEWMK